MHNEFDRADVFFITRAKELRHVAEFLEKRPEGTVADRFSFPPLQLAVVPVTDPVRRQEMFVREEALGYLTSYHVAFTRRNYDIRIFHAIRNHKEGRFFYFHGICPYWENAHPVMGFVRLPDHADDYRPLGAMLFFIGIHSPPAEKVWGWFTPSLPLV